MASQFPINVTLQSMLSDNNVISMEEFASDPHYVMKFAKWWLSCTEHDGEVINYYCKDHKTACCHTCSITSHRNCTNVSFLMNELPNLMHEIDSDSINEYMKIIETHLIKFTEVNESNISFLESQVKDLTRQIKDLRKKINDVLDKLERKVKIEGDRICREEIIKKKEENDQCQRLINSIRNSCTLLETFKKCGTEMQVFLMTEKMMSQLTSYLDQYQEKYTKTETTRVLLEMNPQVQLILSTSPDNLATITGKSKLQRLPVPNIRKPRRNCLVQRDTIFKIEDNDDLLPNYTGITYLYTGDVMLTDYDNNKICLLSSSDNSVTSYKLQCNPCEICVVDDADMVAVTLPERNTVLFLSVRDGNISLAGKINTGYECDGIAYAGNGKIVVSGGNAEGGQYYWSLINSRGKQVHYQLDCDCDGSHTYVALDSSFTHVYITVSQANSMYCFDLRGSQKFIYDLYDPRGVVTDRYDNVYVVGCGSNDIHQLTPDGIVIQIISDGVPSCPVAICISRDGDKILITNYSDSSQLYQYRLK